MTDNMRDDVFDRQIRDFLARHAAETYGAPSANDIATRISSRVGTRAIGLRLAPQVMWVVLTGVLIMGLVGAGLVGASLLNVSIAEPTPTPLPSPTSVVSQPPSHPLVATGTTSTAIGQLSWTSVRGDATNLPAGEIFEIPGGFAAIDFASPEHTSRLWESTDGVTWTVAPMPVPASAPARHWVTSGGHWLWSSSDFRLWHSSDFVTWTEVALDGLEPSAIAGVDWKVWPVTFTTVGTTTVVPLSVAGRLVLDQLLDFQLEIGEQWELDWSRADLPLGTVRDVFTTRHPQTSGRSGADPARVHVGSIRVGVDGSFVTITDAERDVILARIDSELVGTPAATMARRINSEGELGGFEGAAVISDGIAQPAVMPVGYASSIPAHGYVSDLFAAQGRFVALAADPRGSAWSLIVWASTNGLDWESLGPPVLPSAASDTAHLQILRRPAGGPGEPLVASVLIDEERGGQRKELWSSVDGLTWVTEGLVYTHDGTGMETLDPFFAPSGGYLATGGDGRLHVSPTGADWTTVNGPEAVGTNVDRYGGMSLVAVTREALFILDVANSGDRVMWIVRTNSGGS